MKPDRQQQRARYGRIAAVVAAATVVGVVVGAPSVQAQRKKITLDELVIEGNIQKPEAFFILPRTTLNFGDLDHREDLRARILQSVQKPPF